MDGAFWKALAFGAILAGSIGPIALLAFTMGALLLPVLDAHASGIRVACAALLIGLGLAMLLRRADAAAAAPASRPAAQALLPTFLLTLVNPMTLVVFAGFVPQLPVAGSPTLAAWLACALFAGILAFGIAGLAGA